MKKILILLTVMLSYFLFSSQFKQDSGNEYQEKFDLFNTFENRFQQKPVSVRLDISKNQKESFQALIDFLKSYPYTVVFSEEEQISGTKKKSVYYLHPESQDIMDTLFDLSSNNIPIFTKATSAYLTSDLSDKEASGYIKYLDKIYNKAYQNVIEIRQLESILDTKTKHKDFLYVYIYENDVNSLLDDITNTKLSHYVIDDEIAIDTVHGVKIDSVDYQFSMKTCFMISLAILMIFIVEISKKKKEIVIRKMFGHSNIYVFKKLFVNDIAVVITAFLLTQIICYIYYVGHFERNTFSFISHLFVHDIILVLCLLIVSTVILLILKFKTNVLDFKKSVTNDLITYIGVVLKIVMLVLLIEPVLYYTAYGMECFQLYYMLGNDEDLYKNYTTIESINTTTYEESKRKIVKFFEDSGAYYQDFDTYFLSKNTDIKLQYEYDYPYIEVNRNYLLQYKIVDINNQPINFDNLPKDALFVPEKYKSKKIVNDNNSKIIFVKNGYNYKNYALPLLGSNTRYLKDPVIHYYENIWSLSSSKNLQRCMLLHYQNGITPETIYKFLEQNNLKQEVNLTYSEPDYFNMYYRAEDAFIQSLIVVTMYLIAILVILYEYISIYFLENKVLIGLRYLLGDTFIERYSLVFSFTLISYIMVDLIAYFLLNISFSMVLEFTLLTLMYEMLILYITIKRIEKQNIVTVLKGDI